MKNRILLRTNLFVCIVVIVGFLLTAILSYRSNYSSSINNIEQVSAPVSYTHLDVYKRQVIRILLHPCIIKIVGVIRIHLALYQPSVL